MSLFDAIAQAASLGYQISKDQHLTGAQREANAFTAQQNQAAMDFAAGQTRLQMAFQERMANSQWQRGVADMQAAGLNPALAYSQGGAVAPSGAAASGSAGSSVDPGRGMSMSDMLAAISFKKEMELKDMQIDSLKQDVEAKRLDNEGRRIDLLYKDELTRANLGNILEHTSYLIEQGNLTRFQYQVLGPAQKALAEAQKLAAEKQSAKIDADMVYTNWRNEFYENNGFWPSEKASSYFWNFISAMIDQSGKSPSELQVPAVGFSYP